VGRLLVDAGATVNGFTRYEVGEGIEKKVEDFAAEVASQLNS
ncbi:MAG: elongation factor Ts, partial [Gammaproteobacteria bacterium]|nr:elongation factor Ts [Gammaproteobacteria bacterium]